MLRCNPAGSGVVVRKRVVDDSAFGIDGDLDGHICGKPNGSKCFAPKAPCIGRSEYPGRAYPA